MAELFPENQTAKADNVNFKNGNAPGVSANAYGSEQLSSSERVSARGAARGGSSVETAQAMTVLICDTQPVTIEGVRALLESCGDLQFLEGTDSLSQAAEITRQHSPEVLMVDKAFGVQAILEWLAACPVSETAIVVWGISITEAEALRFLQAGARGILRKTAEVASVVACLRSVAGGRSWMEDCVFRETSRGDRYPRTELTAREQQVLELVEQGCKNKEIAQELGIRPGTVKIHLKHIFEKTGVRGRYGLALNGWRERGSLSMPM
ncbi:MAG TPA: response regulator transcription factor [Bryobacteraceae bacterium]|nr:response regulator transcription factor [Bryobacteraceae bacterium]